MILMSVIFFMLGCFFTWFTADFFHKKSLREQGDEAQKEIKKLLSFLKDEKNNHEIFLARVLAESIEEYKQAGTPVRVLDSYDNLSIEEKAGLYDKVMLRVKGRLGKSNKYRKNNL